MAKARKQKEKAAEESAPTNPGGLRDRIKELRRVSASDLKPNPKNWRTHPKSQQEALRGLLEEIGIADACIARETADGSLVLIDGHLRADTFAEGTQVPVLVLDVTEQEADKLLITLDPLAAMAGIDASQLASLLGGFETGSEALQRLVEATASEAGLYKELTSQGEKEVAELVQSDATDFVPSGVRMVQLFLDESSIGEFQRFCEELGAVYSTANITDTVLEALRRESALLQVAD